MNNYIVWYADKEDKYSFSREFSLSELIQNVHLDEISDSLRLSDHKVDCILPGIGKKDINGENIYADCSIVEFDYVSKKPKSTQTKKCGYFTWDKLNLCYRLDKMIFNPMRMKNLKIVDTIQNARKDK